MSLSRRMNQQALGTLARIVGWALLVLLLCLVINYYRPDHHAAYIEEHYYPDYRKTMVNGIYTDKDTKWRDQQFHKKGRPLELTTTTWAPTPERQADETTTTLEGEVTTIAKQLHSKTVTSEKPTTQETAAETSDRKTTTEERTIEETTVENTDRETTTEEQTKEKTTAETDSKTTTGERVIEETTSKTSNEETTAGEQANEKTTNVASDEATGKPANEDTPRDGHTTKTIDETSGRHVTPKRGKGKGTNDIEENTTETPGDTSTNGNIGKSTNDDTGSKSKAQAEAILRKGMVRNKLGESKKTEKESAQSDKGLKIKKNGTNDGNEGVREALAELENDKEQINNKKVGDKAPETGSIKNKGKLGKDIGKELASDENMIDKDDRGVVKGEAGEDDNIENGSIISKQAKVRIGIKSERAIAKALDTFLAEKKHFNNSEVDDTMVKKRAIKNKLQTLFSGANV